MWIVNALELNFLGWAIRLFVAANPIETTSHPVHSTSSGPLPLTVPSIVITSPRWSSRIYRVELSICLLFMTRDLR